MDARSVAVVKYLVNQMLLHAVTYREVVTARPDLKEAIDLYIVENGLENDIDKTL